jgi:hypothetical protein
MASSAGHLVSTVEITELVDVCERMSLLNRVLFEQLGSWVADESDPRRQQWFAVACHRHAWHADLWTERRPRIPVDGTRGDVGLPSTGDDRAAWYRERLGEIQGELAAIETQIDATLDPSTSRVIHLVAADLATLAASAPS